MSSAPRVFVILPALNEQDALPLVLAALPREPISAIVVADNGSSDATAERALQAGALVVREEQRGYGSACWAAWQYLREQLAPQPADILVFLDADGSDHPEELPRLLAPLLEERADLVIGSRVLGGGSSALTPQQRFGNALACVLLRLCFGARHTDLGPFRAVRVQAFEHARLQDRDYGWTVELQIKAASSGMRVVEVPVSYRARQAGQSKIAGTLRGSLLAGWKILGWILRWRCALWFTSRRIPKYLGSPRSADR